MARNRSNRECTNIEFATWTCGAAVVSTILAIFFYYLLSPSHDTDDGTDRLFDPKKYWAVAGGIIGGLVFLTTGACLYPKLKECFSEGENSVAARVGRNLTAVGTAMTASAQRNAQRGAIQGLLEDSTASYP